MGAKWVFVWRPNHLKADNNQMFDNICRCMIFFGAVKEADQRRSYFTFIEPNINDQSQAVLDRRYVAAISLAEETDRYYYLIRRDERTVDQISISWVKSQKQLQAYAFEVFQYRLGNLRLRVGKVIKCGNGGLKKVFMEVDYLTSFSIERTRNYMKLHIQMWQELASLKSWPGQFVQIERKYAEYGMPDNYTPQHTVLQYYGVINSLKLGTKWVFVWEPSVGPPEEHGQLFNKICQYAESAFDTVGEATWRSTLTIMSDESQAAPCHVVGIRLVEEPNKVYLVQPDQHKLLEEDIRTMAAPFKKLQTSMFAFEGRSMHCRRDELQLQVGRVTDKKSTISDEFFVEVVYLNNFSIERTRNLMEEHLNMWNRGATEGSWQGQFVQIERRYAEFCLSNDNYTHRHTALQYYAVMAHVLAEQHRRQDARQQDKRPFSFYWHQF